MAVNSEFEESLAIEVHNFPVANKKVLVLEYFIEIQPVVLDVFQDLASFLVSEFWLSHVFEAIPLKLYLFDSLDNFLSCLEYYWFLRGIFLSGCFRLGVALVI